MPRYFGSGTLEHRSGQYLPLGLPTLGGLSLELAPDELAYPPFGAGQYEVCRSGGREGRRGCAGGVGFADDLA